MASKSQVLRWPLTKLKDHPLQAKMFGDISDAELEILANDLTQNGLKHPIEILADGTIVCGHQRVRAARKLNWKTIDAIVRHDLENAGDGAIEVAFIGDNFIRRQLGPLARARCIWRLLEIAQQNRTTTAVGDAGTPVKDEIAKQLGQSRRTINRYLLLLKAPIEVQQAFDGGRLPLIEAGRVALLDPKVQTTIAKGIAAGEDPKKAIEETNQRDPKPKQVIQSFYRFVRTLRREMPTLREQQENLDPMRISRVANTLKEASEFLDGLLASTTCE